MAEEQKKEEPKAGSNSIPLYEDIEDWGKPERRFPCPFTREEILATGRRP